MGTPDDERVDRILNALSWEQKIALCSGEDFWHTKAFTEAGVPSVMMCDGPHGLRKQVESADMLGLNDSEPATCFPTASLTACGFDEELLSRMGAAIGREARARGVHMVLGPGTNIKRNPLCGRNFEYFSEDPLLSGTLAAAEVKGIQSTGVGACVKHFALNNQEYKRFNSDSRAGERTMREIYLASFERVVKQARPWSVMCSYNLVNGRHASTNRYLLTSVLRDEWGFDGMVVTDWGALSDRKAAFEAGCDLCMPGGAEYGEREALEALENGSLAREDVEASARRVVEFALRGLAGPEGEEADDIDGLLAENYKLACEVAEQSIVLLKNDDDILPLNRGDSRKVLFVGPMAKHPRYQGSGSSHINPAKQSNVLSKCPGVRYVQGCGEDGSITEQQLAEIEEKAHDARTVVVFAGLPESRESEGFDRADMAMPPGHLAMINAAVRANENVVVVLMCGSPVEVPWHARVKAIVYAGLAGEAGGEAIARILFGDANPSGKLAETWPVAYADCVSSSYYGQKDACYREGAYVGYRYYRKAHVPVRFPFGHGLSYTRFEYGNAQVACEESAPVVSVDVSNVGRRGGSEVVQVYVACRDENTYRAPLQLGGFAKLHLVPGEVAHVEIPVDERAFCVWDGGWKRIGGTYDLLIGASSEDIRCSLEVTVDGQEVPAAPSPWYESPVGAPSEEDFEALYGKRTDGSEAHRGTYTMDNSIAEMAHDSLLMKAVYSGLKFGLGALFALKGQRDSAEKDMFLSASADCSLSALKVNSGMAGHAIEGMLDFANGHAITGLKKITGLEKGTSR